MRNPDPFQYIRDYYRVAAYKGARVAISVDGIGKPARQGVICGVDGHYIKVHFDGDAKPYGGVFHPTDGVKYLTLAETN